MSDDNRTWTATHERTPYENLRALMRHVDDETPTTEIIRLAFVRIPGLGSGDEHIVERIRDACAEEHALARAQRWLATQDESPTVTLSDERRTLPVDTDGEVHPAEVRAVVAHRLGARPARTCENGSVIECTGPDESGYNCPDCCQQRRREDAIIDALLDSYETDTDDSQSSTMTDTTDETAASTDETPAQSSPATRAGDEPSTTPDVTEGQCALDAFASGEGGEHA